MTDPRFRLWGFPVRIHASFGFVVLFGLAMGSVSLAVVWVVAVFVTTLVHELGHAFAFRAFGQEASVSLWGFGGFTQGLGPRLGRKQHILVSLAGPLTEMALIGLPALLFAARSPPGSVTTENAIDLIVWIGVGWAVLNLLPILPLDGGHVAANILEGVWGEAGARAARWVSIGVSGAGATYAFAEGYAFAAIYGLYFMGQNATELSQLRDGALLGRLLEGHRALEEGDRAAAERVAEEVHGSARRPGVRAQATELAAWSLLAGGQRAEAESALTQLPEDVRPSRWVRAYSMVVGGRNDAAVETTVDGLVDPNSGWPPNYLLAASLEVAGALDAVVQRLMTHHGEPGRAAVDRLSHDLHRAARFAVAARLSQLLFDDGSYEPGRMAYNAACSLARVGEATEALLWLERAVRSGFDDRSQFESDEDLEALRRDARFDRIRDQLSGTR